MNGTIKTVVQTLIWVCVGYVIFKIFESIAPALGLFGRNNSGGNSPNVVGAIVGNSGDGSLLGLLDDSTAAAEDIQKQSDIFDASASHLDGILNNLTGTPDAPAGFSNVTDPYTGKVNAVPVNFWNPDFATGLAEFNGSLIGL